MTTRLVLYPTVSPFITEHAVRLVERVGREVEVAAKVAAPKRTGRLAASIQLVLEPGNMAATARVGSDLDYAASIHEGTRAHEIRPHPGNVLFLGPGIFAELVHHPRTSGNPFLMVPLARIGRANDFIVTREHRP